MQVPSKDYGRQYEELWPELGPELQRVLLNEDPVLGASLARFEEAFASYLECEAVVGVGSGTDALILALRAAGVRPRDGVVTPANTFVATVTAIVAVGAMPILVDPDPDTLLLDTERTLAAIGADVRAVVPVHLYGAAVELGELGDTCRARGIAIVEDAAQAHGARTSVKAPGGGSDLGARVGTLGEYGCFSFHPSKNLGAFGDGGAIACSNARAAELRTLRNLGKASKYAVSAFAPNSKLDTLQAAILALKLPKLEAANARRREHAARYRAALEGIDELRLPPLTPPETHVYHLFVVRTRKRDALARHLRDCGVRAGMHYPIPVHLQEAGASLGYPAGAFPVTEEAARSVLSLPIAPELSDAEVDHVAASVRAFFDTREGRA